MLREADEALVVEVDLVKEKPVQWDRLITV
jgi:hypothetical protein